MYRYGEQGRVFLYILCATLLFCFSVALPLHTHAQSVPGVSTGLHLTTVPQFPTPHAPVEISVDDYSLDTTGATITWYVDGKEHKEFENERTITIQTGAVGTKIPVRVALTRQNTLGITSDITVLPTAVDVILEAGTHIPDFYRGRALPTTDSLLRAIAVVHDGGTTPDAAYTYRWTIGTTVLGGGPQKGKNVIEFPMPHFSDMPIVVEVFNANGSVIGRGSVQLAAVEPELHFYENSPLRGLSEREVVSPVQLLGQEATFFGEPYYINARMNESDATFVWNNNGQEQTFDHTIPNAITLRSIGGSGEATIGLSVTTKGQIQQFIENTFQLVFK